ncbi:hypothetical protein ABZ403_32105 [Micromonospora zamorensis]|uniref:hypothetical protein n=1 Tax=Micromonospora zamorensis TaxID=709883 RepID=UPI0033C5AE09
MQLQVAEALGQADGVIVPGGGWLNRAAEGAWAQAQRGVLPATLAALAPSARWMASVCTGALSAGLDLGLWLTERELGAATANRVAATIEYRPQTPTR